MPTETPTPPLDAALGAWLGDAERVKRWLAEARQHAATPEPKFVETDHATLLGRCAWSDNRKWLALLADREAKLAAAEEKLAVTTLADDDRRWLYDALRVRAAGGYLMGVEDTALRVIDALRADRQRLHALVAEAESFIDPERHAAWFEGATAETFPCDERFDKLEAAERQLAAVRELAQCGVNYADEPPGFTCRSLMQRAREHPDKFTLDYGQQCAAGANLCNGCRIAHAVDADPPAVAPEGAK